MNYNNGRNTGKSGKFKAGLTRFFYGRYGNDELNRFLFYVYIAVLIIYLFTTSFIVLLLETALLVISILRMMSRNIAARRAENDKYLAIKRKIKGFFVLRKDMFHDRKTNVYKKCPSCKAILRLPKAKGEHTVKCPACGERFTVH